MFTVNYTLLFNCLWLSRRTVLNHCSMLYHGPDSTHYVFMTNHLTASPRWEVSLLSATSICSLLHSSTTDCSYIYLPSSQISSFKYFKKLRENVLKACLHAVMLKWTNGTPRTSIHRFIIACCVRVQSRAASQETSIVCGYPVLALLNGGTMWVGNKPPEIT